MIQLRGITKSFGSLQVLRGIDLDIARGEIVSIVGPSGAGKTTLLQIMGTLDRPDSGQTLIDGQDVSRLGEKRLALFRYGFGKKLMIHILHDHIRKADHLLWAI